MLLLLLLLDYFELDYLFGVLDLAYEIPLEDED